VEKPGGSPMTKYPEILWGQSLSEWGVDEAENQSWLASTLDAIKGQKIVDAEIFEATRMSPEYIVFTLKDGTIFRISAETAETAFLDMAFYD
jgi:hypothetical protein